MKKYIKCNKMIALLVFFFSVINSLAQEYKTPKAYIIDFSKNEDYVNNAMIEYSKSIIQLSPESRKVITFNKLLDKLVSINQILTTTDKGYKKDNTLKDAFINLNSKVIYYLKNDFLNLKDYEQQGLLSDEEIKVNFIKKDNSIKQFFQELKKYDSLKKKFASKYNIIIKTSNKKNVFEYNAYQNFIFYKLNVLDGKLIKAIESKYVPDIIKANESLVTESYQAIKETTQLETEYTDQTLNNASEEWIYFLLKQSDEMVKSAIMFFNFYNDFQKIKKETAQSNDAITIEQYNAKVKEFNQIKNNYSALQSQFQIQKEKLRNAWFETNSKFLINNIDFDKINNTIKE